MRKFAIAAMLLLALGCSTDNVLSKEEQLKKDMAAIDKYLEKNGIVATEDPSGLRLVVENAGSGLPPTLVSKLTVRYTGKYMNGTIFDESRLNSSGTPVPFETPLGDLIEGWQIGFTYVAKGGKATFYIPSGLAYGPAGRSGIPSNSNLIFEIELIGFTN